jgi:oxygen-independent coproporphyrinogen-3 oxidase
MEQDRYTHSIGTASESICSQTKTYSRIPALIVASLYLHIPFCEHKCIYCDFYSIAPDEGVVRSELPTGRFLDALKKEIELRAAAGDSGVLFETVFFGGGTPSLLTSSELSAIMEHVARHFSIAPNAEITVETNPGTVNRQKLQEFRSLGINRLSIGVQSFHNDDLQFLTRIHSAEEAKRCVHDAFASGFKNVSIDLIFSLPSQTTERWISNLDQAMELNPTHISCYSLIVEANTPLFRMVERKQVSLLSAETDAELYEITIAYLAGRGYEQYEVSNFAKPGFQSRHNKSYWDHSDYLGFGPSAHSFMTRGRHSDGPERSWNVANLSDYCSKLEQGQLPVIGMEHLAVHQLVEEEIFLGLRSEGIDLVRFRKLFGKDLMTENELKVKELLETSLAVVENGKLRLTAKGYPLCDEICASLLS